MMNSLNYNLNSEITYSTQPRRIQSNEAITKNNNLNNLNDNNYDEYKNDLLKYENEQENLNPNLNTSTQKGQPLLRRKSSLFQYISEEDLKLVKERDFTPEHKKIKKDEEEKKIIPITNIKVSPGMKQYQINTNQNSLIKLPPNFITEDYDLKVLCDLINEQSEKGWVQIYKENDTTILRKSVDYSPAIILKTFAKIKGFYANEVYEAIADVNIRKKWDVIFSEFKILEENSNSEILYMKLESPSRFVSDRDFVQQRKTWFNFPENNSICMHFRSVDSNKAPVEKKVVRGEIIISGYYIRTVSRDPLVTHLTIISQSDIKGHIPQWLVNKVAQKAPKDWVINLYRGCKMVLEKNKK